MSIRLKLVIGGVVVLVVGVLVGIFVASQQNPIHIPDTARKEVTFGIILPKKLPSQFYVASQPTFDTEKHVLSTKLQVAKSGTITISQQTKPKDTDLKQIDSQENFLSTVGSVYVLKGEAKRIQVIIDASDSWLFINGDDSVGITTVKTLIDSLAVR